MSVTHRVLVPFELPDADPIAPVLVETLAAMEVVVLGHYGLPEQTPPGAARDQFESDATEELEHLAAPFEETGIPVTTRLVFGHARAKTLDRVAVEEDCDVILTPGEVESVDRVFVPLRGDANLDPITSFVADVLSGADATVTLFHAGESADDREGETLLSDAADRLVQEGLDRDRITWELTRVDDVGGSIVDVGEEFDLLVLGETEPTLRDRILGAIPAQVTADTTHPAFVIRNPDHA